MDEDEARTEALGIGPDHFEQVEPVVFGGASCHVASDTALRTTTTTTRSGAWSSTRSAGG